MTAHAPTAVVPPVEPRTLRQRAVRGSAWTLAGFGASQALRLGGNLVLAGLLTTDMFGLVALAMVCVQGLQMFSDVGIGPSIIRSHRGVEPAFRSTAWTIQIGRGLALWAAAAALAVPAARLFDAPALAPIIVALGAKAAIEGFNSTALFTQSRNLALGRQTVATLVSQIVNVAVMLTWAWMRPTPWAMVAGSLAGAATLTALTHRLVPGQRDRIGWEPGAARELLTFGRWIFVSTAVSFLAQQADRLILGKLEPLTTLGVYHLALMLAMTSREVTVKLTHSVFLPMFSEQMRRDLERMRSRVRVARRTLLTAGLACVLAVALGGPVFFDALYGNQWAAAGWMSRALSAVCWVGILQASATPALLALNAPRSLAASNTARFVVTLSASVGGHFAWGLPGFIGGTLVGAIAGHIVVLRAMRAVGVAAWRQDLALSAVGGAVAGAGILAQESASLVWGGTTLRVVEAGIAALIAGAAALVAARTAIRTLRAA